MSINLKIPDIRELKPRITVFGVGGAGGNAVNNMITAGLRASISSSPYRRPGADVVEGGAHHQMGVTATEGLGAGSRRRGRRSAAEEVIDEIRDHLTGAHMVFVTAGMGGGTGTGAAPVVAKAARDLGILTVGVVTKPFHFEGQRRMRVAETGIRAAEGRRYPDHHSEQNLFRVANEKTTFADARDGRPGALLGRCLHHRPDGEGGPDQSRLCRCARGHARDGQGHDGHRRGIRREALAACRRGGDLEPADRRCVDARRQGSVDLDHRRQRPYALRGGRGRDAHPRGGRSGS